MSLDRVPHRADEVLRVEQREQLVGFLDRDHLEFHTEVAATCNGHVEPIDSFAVGGEREAPWQMDAAVLTRLRFDLLVQLDRVLLERGHVGVAVQGVHAARGMPRGSGGEFLALDQHDVVPAVLGEVVQH